MKTSTVSFAHLRHLLLALGFTESRPKGDWRFQHRKSGADFIFRPYADDEYVNMPDVVGTRTHLDWHGLLAAKDFDETLAKRPA